MTPPEQARVEQRHEDLVVEIVSAFGADTKRYPVTFKRQCQLLANFKRDIRAEMKRAVLAEIEDFQGLFDSDNRHARAMQGMDEPILDELKRRIEGL